jgi:UDP-N-acetylmuramoyl-tripeptide--D-alanyl-D-alanine ligase
VIATTLGDLAQAVGGVLADPADARVVVDGPVVTDAREGGPGGLYVVRRGEHADGMDYVEQAAERGVVALLADRPSGRLPTVVVDDVQAAFGSLARSVLERLPDLVVVAITGSSGKTSAKDLLAQVLGRLGPTVATAASYNGEVGVPLTVLRADEGTRYLVLEMGARGPGHLTYLTRIARPRVGVVLNVGSAHVGAFGSVETTARAKSELVAGTDPGGLVVLNADDPRVAAMAQVSPADVVLTGWAADAAVRAVDVDVDDQARARFTLRTSRGSTPVRLRLHGEHHVSNALQVAAVALHLGLPLTEVAEALGAAEQTSPGRMQVTERADGVLVVNDAYNANPESVRAALKALVAMGSGRRTWAVLGEMLELGPDAISEHDAIGRLAVRLDVSHLVVVGAGARAIHTGAVMEGSWGEESVHVPDVEAAHALLTEQLRPGDVVLLKASRDSGLRALGDRLAAEGGGSA